MRCASFPYVRCDERGEVIPDLFGPTVPRWRQDVGVDRSGEIAKVNAWDAKRCLFVLGIAARLRFLACQGGQPLRRFGLV